MSPSPVQCQKPVSMSSFSVVVLAAGYGTRLLADVELRPDLPQWRYLTQVRGSLN